MSFDDEFVCRSVCAECPFRTGGKSRVEISPHTARRIVEDVTTKGLTFPCHQTSTPMGLGTVTADRADWRFCAGAYLTMSEEERKQNATLKLVTRMGFHRQTPAGKSVVFKNLKLFQQHYERLSRESLLYRTVQKTVQNMSVGNRDV